MRFAFIMAEGGMMADKDIHKRHFEIAKRMVEGRRLSNYHQMGEELQKAKTLLEFDAILDKYETRRIPIQIA